MSELEIHLSVCVCVCVCVCARARAGVCVCARVCACVCVCVFMRAWVCVWHVWCACGMVEWFGVMCVCGGGGVVWYGVMWCMCDQGACLVDNFSEQLELLMLCFSSIKFLPFTTTALALALALLPNYFRQDGGNNNLPNITE